MAKKKSPRTLTPTPTLRIIGGIWRGRKLVFNQAEGLRPTADRLRETLFNWLQREIRESHCLDLFAGSGALGFEAASRGAAKVSLIETNARTVQKLEQNRLMLAADRIDVQRANAAAFLQTTDQTYNIVFVDPPFSQEILGASCVQLESSAALSTNAIIYVESPVDQDYAVPVNWVLWKNCRAGKVVAALYQRR